MIIPRSIRLFTAPVELPGIYERIDLWRNAFYGLDFSPVRSYAVNNFYPVILQQEAFLSLPALLVCIELAEARTSDVYGEVSFIAKRNGTFHGMGGWFSAELSTGVSMSNAPDIMNPRWTHLFFPLEKPVSLQKGDSVRVIIHAVNNGEVWRWQVECDDRQTRFDQSNFFGFPLSKKRRRKQLPHSRMRVKRSYQESL